MQDLNTLLEIVKSLKRWSVVSDFAIPIVIIIALVIVYIIQRRQIEALKNYLDLWKPKELREDLEAYIELKDKMHKDRAASLEKEVESLQNGYQTILKQYEESKYDKSTLENQLDIFRWNIKHLVSTIYLLKLLLIHQEMHLNDFQILRLDCMIKLPEQGFKKAAEFFNRLSEIGASLDSHTIERADLPNPDTIFLEKFVVPEKLSRIYKAKYHEDAHEIELELKTSLESLP